MTKIILLCTLLTSQLSLALDFISNDLYKQPSFGGRQSVGDLNGDGYNDIFSSGIFISCDDARYCYGFYPGNETAKILLNNKIGGFEELEGFELNPQLDLGHTIIADMDNDGDNDIISSTGTILVNNGNTTFLTRSLVFAENDKTSLCHRL